MGLNGARTSLPLHLKSVCGVGLAGLQNYRQPSPLRLRQRGGKGTQRHRDRNFPYPPYACSFFPWPTHHLA